VHSFLTSHESEVSVCGGIRIKYHTNARTGICANNTIPLRMHNLCSRPHAFCLAVSRNTDSTLQFSFALATPFSLFIRLWWSDDKISWLGEWACQWRPTHLSGHITPAEKRPFSTKQEYGWFQESVEIVWRRNNLLPLY
jgi:hypothetical protein